MRSTCQKEWKNSGCIDRHDHPPLGSGRPSPSMNAFCFSGVAPLYGLGCDFLTENPSRLLFSTLYQCRLWHGSLGNEGKSLFFSSSLAFPFFMAATIQCIPRVSELYDPTGFSEYCPRAHGVGSVQQPGLIFHVVLHVLNKGRALAFGRGPVYDLFVVDFWTRPPYTQRILTCQSSLHPCQNGPCLFALQTSSTGL